MQKINAFTWSIALVLFFEVSGSADEPQSHFTCKMLGTNSFKPYYLKQSDDGSFVDFSKTSKGLLGQSAMKTIEECQTAVGSAQNEFGVICSRTGLGGWKPTIYTGTLPGRADFGYLGGSSITKFSDCLTATSHASVKGVCYWGGSDWYVSAIDRAQTIGGPYRTLGACAAETKTP